MTRRAQTPGKKCGKGPNSWITGRRHCLGGVKLPTTLPSKHTRRGPKLIHHIRWRQINPKGKTTAGSISLARGTKKS